MPAQAPLPIWKGNTLTRTYRFRTGPTQLLDLTGSTLVFRAAWLGGEIRQNLAIAAPLSGEAELSLTVEQTRSIPTGDTARYEIERWIAGRQETLLFGKVVASEWVNVDV